MDPLSIIAGVAGISQAGASLSVAIFRVIIAAKSAPKEISDIARGVSDLSIILRELRRVLRDGRRVYRRRIIRHIGVAIHRIGIIHQEIEELLGLESDFSRLKWAFRRSKATQLLYQIESHKTGVNLIVQTMILASQLKLHSSQHQDPKEDKEDTKLLRQQAENLVQVSYQSLRSLVMMAENGFPKGYSHGEANDLDENSPEQSTENQIQLYKAGFNDTATWLYGLVFSSVAEAATAETQVLAQIGKTGADDANGPDSRVLIRPRTGELAKILDQPIKTLLRRPTKPRLTLNELLSEWTTLTEEEIEGVVKPEKETVNDDLNAKSKAKDKHVSEESENLLVINFKDALGRKFVFPFALVKTWAGIQECIKQCFLHVENLGPQVADGQYNLMVTEGFIIIPQCWEMMIRPGASITMQMLSKPDQTMHLSQIGHFPGPSVPPSAPLADLPSAVSLRKNTPPTLISRTRDDSRRDDSKRDDSKRDDSRRESTTSRKHKAYKIKSEETLVKRKTSTLFQS